MTTGNTSDKPSRRWFSEAEQWKIIPAAITMFGAEWLLAGVNLFMRSEVSIAIALTLVGCLAMALGVALLFSRSDVT